MNIAQYLEINNIKKIIKKIIIDKSFQNFIIIALVAVIQLLTNTILGRKLSKEEFGLFSFVFLNVINFLAVLFLFGQGSSIIRYFSSKNIEEYKWKSYFLQFNLAALVPILIVSFIVIKIYDLSITWYIIIIIGLFLRVSTSIIVPFFRARGKFNTAVTLERAHPVVFFIILITFYLFVKDLTIMDMSVMKLFSFLIFIPFILYILIKWKSGQKKVERDIIKDGLALWEVNITVIVLTSVDAFFIAKILDYKELALYNILILVTQIYEFTRISLFNIYAQKFSKTPNFNITRFLKILILLCAIISVFYLCSTDLILEILFRGKYNASFLLIILFCVYGSLSILYIIPSCYLVGQSKRTDMRKMLIVNALSLAIKLALIFLLSSYGLNGFLTAAILSQLFRTAGGYYLVFRGSKD